MIQGELRVHQEDKQSKASRNYARTHDIQHKTWKKQQDTQETTQQANKKREQHTQPTDNNKKNGLIIK